MDPFDPAVELPAEGDEELLKALLDGRVPPPRDPPRRRRVPLVVAWDAVLPVRPAVVGGVVQQVPGQWHDRVVVGDVLDLNEKPLTA